MNAFIKRHLRWKKREENRFLPRTVSFLVVVTVYASLSSSSSLSLVILPFSNVYTAVSLRHNGTIFSLISIYFIWCNCESPHTIHCYLKFIASKVSSIRCEVYQYTQFTDLMWHKISIRQIESVPRTYMCNSAKNFNAEHTHLQENSGPIIILFCRVFPFIVEASHIEYYFTKKEHDNNIW